MFRIISFGPLVTCSNTQKHTITHITVWAMYAQMKPVHLTHNRGNTILSVCELSVTWTSMPRSAVLEELGELLVSPAHFQILWRQNARSVSLHPTLPSYLNFSLYKVNVCQSFTNFKTRICQCCCNEGECGHWKVLCALLCFCRTYARCTEGFLLECRWSQVAQCWNWGRYAQGTKIHCMSMRLLSALLFLLWWGLVGLSTELQMTVWCTSSFYWDKCLPRTIEKETGNMLFPQILRLKSHNVS